MPRGARTSYPIELDADSRATLARWLRRSKTTMRLAKRVQALLLLADGTPYAVTSRRVGMAEWHVRRWAARFRAEGLHGILDRQRPERMPGLAPRAQRSLKD